MRAGALAWSFPLRAAGCRPRVEDWLLPRASIREAGFFFAVAGFEVRRDFFTGEAFFPAGFRFVAVLRPVPAFFFAGAAAFREVLDAAGFALAAVRFTFRRVAVFAAAVLESGFRAGLERAGAFFDAAFFAPAADLPAGRAVPRPAGAALRAGGLFAFAGVLRFGAALLLFFAAPDEAFRGADFALFTAFVDAFLPFTAGIGTTS